MTEVEMLDVLKMETGSDDTALLASYLESAKSAVINKAYPFREGINEVPRKYQRRTIEIATYLFNKRGAEGETIHIENGTDRHYESASVPPSMLAGIIPLAKIPTSEDAE